MNKGDKEAASHTDTWGGSIPAEGVAQAGDGSVWMETVQVSAAGVE